jgi:hypothetical protein
MRNNMIVALAMIFVSATLFSKPKIDTSFIGNENYIYGEGWGKTKEEADKNALADLSHNIQTEVKSVISTRMVNGHREILTKTTSVSESIIQGSIPVIEKAKRQYHAYRYVNVKAHVMAHMFNYNNIMEDYFGEEDSELQAGYLYLAYASLDDPIMDRFNNGNEEMKKSILSRLNYLKDMTAAIVLAFKDSEGNDTTIGNIDEIVESIGKKKEPERQMERVVFAPWAKFR